MKTLTVTLSMPNDYEPLKNTTKDHEIFNSRLPPNNQIGLSEYILLTFFMSPSILLLATLHYGLIKNESIEDDSGKSIKVNYTETSDNESENG